MTRIVFHTDMVERLCVHGAQPREPAGPPYTTWGQVWDDMRDEEWYADSFRPGGRCHFPRVREQALERAQALTDFWYDLGYHQTQEEDAPSVGDHAEQPVPGDLVEHVVLVEAPRRDPDALLGTMAPMNNWHHMVGHYSNSVHLKRYRTSRVRGRKATVRSQHRTIRRIANLALAQVA